MKAQCNPTTKCSMKKKKMKQQKKRYKKSMEIAREMQKRNSMRSNNGEVEKNIYSSTVHIQQQQLKAILLRDRKTTCLFQVIKHNYSSKLHERQVNRYICIRACFRRHIIETFRQVNVLEYNFRLDLHTDTQPKGKVNIIVHAAIGLNLTTT